MTNDLVVKSLTVSRGGRPVLRDVSLSLQPGKITALLGPNGAGKSSLVLTIAGMLQPDSGEIALGGQNLVGLRPEAVRSHGIAAVPEGHQVLTDLTVHENLMVAGSQLTKADLNKGIERVYEIFQELKPLAKQKAGTLSGGQQQMVALGHALVGTPQFMLADELSLGLAPLIVQRLIGVVEDIAQAGIGVLLIEQFTHLALKVADYAYIIDRGKIRFEGTPADIEANPEVLQEAYLGEMTTN